jgi:hypothetical protein
LPGFGDPRVGAPDDIYDITDRVSVRAAVEEVRTDGRSCLLGGFALVRLLSAGPDDRVTIVVRRPGREDLRVTARRRMRADETGQVWSGFSAELDVRLLTMRAATLAVEVERQGVCLRDRLTATQELHGRLPFSLQVGVFRVVRVGSDSHGGLRLATRPHVLR